MASEGAAGIGLRGLGAAAARFGAEAMWYTPIDSFILDSFRNRQSMGPTGAADGGRLEKIYPQVHKLLVDYGLIRQQVAACAHTDPKPEIVALNADLEALRMRLPPEAMAKKIRGVLMKFTHSDVHADKGDLAARVNAALDAISPKKGAGLSANAEASIEAYNRFVEAPPDATLRREAESLFEFCCKADWKQAAKQAAPVAGLLVGPKAGLRSRIAQDFAHAGTARQAGIVFGGVTGAALGVYAVPKALEEMHAVKSDGEHAAAHRLRAAAYGSTALGGLALTAAALNGYRLTGGAIR